MKVRILIFALITAPCFATATVNEADPNLAKVEGEVQYVPYVKFSKQSDDDNCFDCNLAQRSSVSINAKTTFQPGTSNANDTRGSEGLDSSSPNE